MSTEIKSPTYPESVEDGVIAKWVIKVGQTVKQDEVLAEIETDKVVIEVVAPNDGTLKKILKDEGYIVLSGELIAEFDTGEVKTKEIKKEKKDQSDKMQLHSHRLPNDRKFSNCITIRHFKVSYV